MTLTRREVLGAVGIAAGSCALSSCAMQEKSASKDRISASVAFVRTFGDVEDNFIIPTASYRFPWGDKPMGFIVGYRGEIVEDATMNGLFANFYKVY